jgi:molecular chaperone GrpE (heat shock protein)
MPIARISKRRLKTILKTRKTPSTKSSIKSMNNPPNEPKPEGKFHVEQPDIVKRLQRDDPDAAVYISKLQDEIEQLRQRLFELEEEMQTWQDRYESERQGHEATMKAWDEERSGL